MDVLIEFCRLPPESALEAVWIIDSVENRRWFETLAGQIDPNSAVFSEDSHPLTILWNVFEHHPNWTEIVVHGEGLSSEIMDGISSEAVADNVAPDQFVVRRGA
jgi:hypothetical protein